MTGPPAERRRKIANKLFKTASFIATVEDNGSDRDIIDVLTKLATFTITGQPCRITFNAPSIVDNSAQRVTRDILQHGEYTQADLTPEEREAIHNQLNNTARIMSASISVAPTLAQQLGNEADSLDQLAATIEQKQQPVTFTAPTEPFPESTVKEALQAYTRDVLASSPYAQAQAAQDAADAIMNAATEAQAAVTNGTAEPPKRTRQRKPKPFNVYVMDGITAAWLLVGQVQAPNEQEAQRLAAADRPQVKATAIKVIAAAKDNPPAPQNGDIIEGETATIKKWDVYLPTDNPGEREHAGQVEATSHQLAVADAMQNWPDYASTLKVIAPSSDATAGPPPFIHEPVAKPEPITPMFPILAKEKPANVGPCPLAPIFQEPAKPTKTSFMPEANAAFWSDMLAGAESAGFEEKAAKATAANLSALAEETPAETPGPAVSTFVAYSARGHAIYMFSALSLLNATEIIKSQHPKNAGMHAKLYDPAMNLPPWVPTLNFQAMRRFLDAIGEATK